MPNNNRTYKKNILKDYEKKGWHKCKTNNIIFPYADFFYQKCFYIGNDDAKVCMEIVEYAAIPEKNIRKSWEVHNYIREKLSITGITIKTNSYTYLKLNFNKMEEDGKKIIRALCKKNIFKKSKKK